MPDGCLCKKVLGILGTTDHLPRAPGRGLLSGRGLRLAGFNQAHEQLRSRKANERLGVVTMCVCVCSAWAFPRRPSVNDLTV